MVSLAAIRELIDRYAEAHDVSVRLWAGADGAWDLRYRTDSLDAEAPCCALTPITVPGGEALFVEVYVEDEQDGGSDRGRFLASVISASIRHQAENHFFGRELAERYEEITLLYTISEILGSVISLEQAASTILREVAETLGVRRAALWVLDPEGTQLEVVASVGMDDRRKPVRIDDGGSITAAVFRNRTPMILEAGDVFPRDDSRGDSDRDSFLSVPVSYTPPRGEARMIGVFNLIGRTVDEGFSAGDQKLITAIASQIGAAVENSRLVAASLQQERMVRELELAHDLQLKLLPSVDQFRSFGEVAGRCVPADSVGGDFYHLFRLPEGRLGVMIGDVSSHGFSAALIMALTMSAVAIHASEGDPPAEVLRRTHRTLIDELESTEMYLTLFYGVIDPDHRTLRYANAGHSHAFHVDGVGTVQRLNATNPPFGIVDLDNYSEESVAWEPKSDVLCLFTDGLSEPLGKTDGDDVITRFVSEHRNEPLDRVIDSLFALAPADPSIPMDDRTALLIRA